MTKQRPEFTPLERQVLLLVAQGCSNALIRARLSLSQRLLAQALQALYTKTGIHPPREPFTPSEIRQRLSAWGRDYFERERG